MHRALEDDDDEPLIPKKDRMVLVFYALSRSWVKQRNLDTYTVNKTEYENKVARMMSKARDSLEKPNISVSKYWARMKKNPRRF